MNDITIPPPPKGDLVVYCPCGCIGYACADSTFDVHAALEIARCMMLGWKPSYLTTEQVRAASWGCEQCKGQKVSSPLPLLATHDDATSDSPRWRVTGTVTFSITFTLDGVVVANTADEALDALAEDPSPLFLLSDEEKMGHEWDDDELTVNRVEDGAPPSQGGRLPDGVEQLAMIL